MSNNSVTVLTVTYGNRVKYVKQIVDSLVNINVINNIVIINNGSLVGNLSEKLFGSSPKVILLNNSENNGSAAGYAQGLKYIFNNLQSRYIWFLDDDNLPSNVCLPGLLRLYEHSTGKELFSAFRDDRVELKTSGSEKKYIQNSFFEFNLKEKIGTKSNINSKESISNQSCIRCDTVPYGGLLLPTNIAQQIGLPNKEYYLYNDDNDYTYRLTKAGYKIYVSFDNEIHDLESSWYRRESVPMFQGFFRTNMLRNGVYTIRNRTYFELSNTTNNRFFYLLNIYIYLCYVFFMYMPKNKIGVKRFILIIRMVYRGLHGKLGQIEASLYQNEELIND